MKKFLSAIALIMVLALSFVCIVACKPDNPNEQPTPDDANKVTVSWYQGSKLLKEEEIDKLLDPASMV